MSVHELYLCFPLFYLSNHLDSHVVYCSEEPRKRSSSKFCEYLSIPDEPLCSPEWQLRKTLSSVLKAGCLLESSELQGATGKSSGF